MNHDNKPWCCKHRWTISYIVVVVTLELLLLVYPYISGV